MGYLMIVFTYNYRRNFLIWKLNLINCHFPVGNFNDYVDYVTTKWSLDKVSNVITYLVHIKMILTEFSLTPWSNRIFKGFFNPYLLVWFNSNNTFDSKTKAGNFSTSFILVSDYIRINLILSQYLLLAKKASNWKVKILNV